MFKTVAISTFFASAAFQVSAEPSSKYDLSVLPADVAARVAHLEQYGNRFEAVIEATLAEWSKPAYVESETGYDLSMLPTGVAAQVVDLQKHGHRFDAAIRAIFVEAMKPSSGFSGHESEVGETVDASPES